MPARRRLAIVDRPTRPFLVPFVVTRPRSLVTRGSGERGHRRARPRVACPSRWAAPQSGRCTDAALAAQCRRPRGVGTSEWTLEAAGPEWAVETVPGTGFDGSGVTPRRHPRWCRSTLARRRVLSRRATLSPLVASWSRLPWASPVVPVPAHGRGASRRRRRSSAIVDSPRQP